MSEPMKEIAPSVSTVPSLVTITLCLATKRRQISASVTGTSASELSKACREQRRLTGHTHRETLRNEGDSAADDVNSNSSRRLHNNAKLNYWIGSVTDQEGRLNFGAIGRVNCAAVKITTERIGSVVITCGIVGFQPCQVRDEHRQSEERLPTCGTSAQRRRQTLTARTAIILTTRLISRCRDVSLLSTLAMRTIFASVH